MSDARSVTVSQEASYSTVPEDIPARLLEDRGRDIPSKRLIVAVDFGTTYSAISYTALKAGASPRYLSLDQIHSVQNYPDDWNFGGDGDRMKDEVPTEVIYPLDQHFREKEDLAISDEAGRDAPGLGINGYGVREGTAFNGRSSQAIFGPRGDEDADAMSIEESSTFRWGYGVHEAWGLVATHSDPKKKALSRFKLLLDNSPTTKKVRRELAKTLDKLKRANIIENRQHVIVDFLTCLLRHAKSELREAGFDDSWKREIVLCVPAIWTQKACRDMQTAMARAMKQAAFEGVDIQNNSIENLFIVSEPEAAAAYVLATERHISPGDTFVLLDAGGGTVDANTYTVSATSPLRLTREVVPPSGGLFGSSYLNEGFKNLLCDLLKDERYLEEGGTTINGHIQKIMITYFEYRVKRSFDIYTAKGFKPFEVPGLRDNPQKRFKRGSVYVSMEDIKNVFYEPFEGIAGLMEDQIKAAMAKDVRVKKVILIGGFAASNSLKRYLQQRLDEFCVKTNCDITLIRPENSTTAVASGAVLRAFNKEEGPKRYAKSSYGILRREPHGDFPEQHRGIYKTYDRHDGQYYVVNTVDWVLKLGEEVPSVWTCTPFLCSHTFDCDEAGPLICEEVLYVSDRSTESHYQLKHPKNAGAEKVGEIAADFTFLRDNGWIHPIDGGENAQGRRVGKPHYRVNYTMVIKVVDRDLQCFAIYGGIVRQRCKINIASAFRPGVK